MTRAAGWRGGGLCACAGGGLRAVAALALLLVGLMRAVPAAQAAHREGIQIAPGVCRSMDIRNSLDSFDKLKGCRVVEGHVHIVLFEFFNRTDFANLSFPELREITGYLFIYRMRGPTSLGGLFPNLSVIRGMQLFKDYSFVIFDNESLMTLGLYSLTTIQRGAVRIQRNDRLCYTNTIDWSRIMANTENNRIRDNYDPRLCGLCWAGSDSDRCPQDAAGRQLCWDGKNCQKVCPLNCGARACMANGRCCHRECLGGCDGDRVTDCHVCRHFSVGYGENRTCTSTCPSGLFQLSRRCVTEEECRKMPPPNSPNRPDPNPPKYQAYKIYKNACVWNCPPGYIERHTADQPTPHCAPCPPSGCSRDCPGGKIDSVDSIERFIGCTRINGSLEIALRARGGNTMALLESALGGVREIHGGLKVTRSDSLLSLMFLKNIERIHRNHKDSEKDQSLYIRQNANLELLWDWSKINKNLTIDLDVDIHLNPKLCYKKIEPLKEIMGKKNFTNLEVSPDNNGDQASCYPDVLNLQVQTVGVDFIVLAWNAYCDPDQRKLLGYSIYYTVAEQNVTHYGQRDACSDTWSVLDVTQEEVRNKSVEVETDPTAIIEPCKAVQPAFKLITNLVPFTRYAIYVKTLTIKQDSTGAQSTIIYFTTKPGRPSPPQSLQVEPTGPHSVFIQWRPPAQPNGTIVHYHVEITAIKSYQLSVFAGNINFCNNPNSLAKLMEVHGEIAQQEKQERPKPVKNGTCECDGVKTTSTVFTSKAEEERLDTNKFEDAVQNEVYWKNPNTVKSKGGSTGHGPRTRRSLEDKEGGPYLVTRAPNTCSTINPNSIGSNATEDGYVAEQYFQVDGNTTTLKVEGMRHYAWYTLSVTACRARPSNSSEAETYCSCRSDNTFLTQALPGADVVRGMRAAELASNVNVTWTPPANPNGFVAAYSVKYSRVEDTSSLSEDGSLQNCVAASECGNDTCRATLRNLLPGNYSVRVTPITAHGAGDGAQAFVYIKDRPASHEWIWGVVGGCVILIMVLAGGIWYAKRELLQPADNNKLFASVNPEYVSTVYVPDEWEVPRANIELIRELGQGSFGMVYEGLARSLENGKTETRCAVKTVNEHATDRERIEFLNEASVMKAFDTHHVVRLLGVVSRGQPTLVIMELMEQGDLKTYLRSHRPDSESSLPKKDNTGNPPTLQNILQMAIEIADGMAYLAAKKFVHRDLAARNCMVAGDLTVKVGDFGMTRDIYETDYYRKGTKGLMPVRWMSPESLKDGVFSSSSDVWSYGVVLWEMATLAMQPYQGLSNEQVLRYVGEGGVMERPEHCPDRLYELMRACWAHRPSARPPFLRLVADLAASAHPRFRQRSFFHSPHGQELYALQRVVPDEETEASEVNVGALATGSGSNLFGVSGRLASGRLASWVRELSSLRSRASDDAAAEPLQPLPVTAAPRPLPKSGPNGVLPPPQPANPGSGC